MCHQKCKKMWLCLCIHVYANVKAREAGEGRCKPLSDDGGALRVRVDHGEGGGPGLGRGGLN